MSDDQVEGFELSEDELIIKDLLKEFKEHRVAVYSMIEDLEKIKVNIEHLFPEKIDARYIRIFEEKVKAMTGLFNSLLDMRKEISKSLKDEIDIRRKVVKDTGGTDPLDRLEEMMDVRKMAKKVEAFQKTLDSQQEKKNND